MTVNVANTSNTNTFEFWLNKTNELANAMSTRVVTTNSNTASGNAAISATFFANSVIVGNTTSNVAIIAPSGAQISSGDYYLNANGNWTQIASGNYSANIAVTTATLIDSFSISTVNSAEYLINIKTNQVNNFVTTKVLMSHNSSDTFLTEYGRIVSNTDFATFTTNVSGTTARLYVTPSIANTTIKYIRYIV